MRPTHPLIRAGLAAAILATTLAAPLAAHAEEPPAPPVPLAEPTDVTPPEITVTAPAAGAVYRTGTRLTIDVACGDPESAIVRCDGAYNQPGESVLLDTPGEYHWIYVAGNAAGLTTRSDIRFRVVPDESEPPVLDWVVRATDPAAWQTQPTEVLFFVAAEPGGSGVERFTVTDSRTGQVTESAGQAITVRAELDGVTEFTAVATDRAGNTAALPPVAVRIDDAVPYIEVLDPDAIATVERGEEAALAYVCHDDASGIDLCAADGGDALDTAALGAFTKRIWARDNVGRVVFLDVDYTVVPRGDTPPSVELRLPSLPDSGIRVGPVPVELVATDDDGVNAIHWRIDGGDWQAVEADSVSFELPCGTTSTVDYWAIDDGGSRTETVTATVESVCPTDVPTPEQPQQPGGGTGAPGDAPVRLAETGAPLAVGLVGALLMLGAGATSVVVAAPRRR